MITGVTAPNLAVQGTETTIPTPAAATDATAIGPGGKLGKNEFLKLLVTQLRYQDPMKPMEGQEVAANLAQFSALEQMTNISAALEGQTGKTDELVKAINNSVAMNTLGRTVTALGDEVVVPKDDAGSAKVSFRSGGDGVGVLKILDSKGKVVAQRDLGAVGSGLQTFDLASAAKDLKPGVYHYAVAVKDSAGKAVDVQTYTTAKVDGISYDPDGAVLTAGPLTIRIGSIVRIEN